MTLNEDIHVLKIGHVGALMADHAKVLSDFEVQTVAEISRRFLHHGREAVTTPEEWAVLDGALKALIAADLRPVALRVAA